MKLLHPKTHEVVAEVYDDHIVFHSRSMENELKWGGIVIPYVLAEKYQGKRVIFPGDPQFVQAFREVHYPFNLREGGLLLVA